MDKINLLASLLLSLCYFADDVLQNVQNLNCKLKVHCTERYQLQNVKRKQNVHSQYAMVLSYKAVLLPSLIPLFTTLFATVTTVVQHCKTICVNTHHQPISCKPGVKYEKSTSVGMLPAKDFQTSLLLSPTSTAFTASPGISSAKTIDNDDSLAQEFELEINFADPSSNTFSYPLFVEHDSCPTPALRTTSHATITRPTTTTTCTNHRVGTHTRTKPFRSDYGFYSHKTKLFYADDHIYQAITLSDAPRKIANMLNKSLMMKCYPAVLDGKRQVAGDIMGAPIMWCGDMFLGWSPTMKRKAWSRLLAYDWASYAKYPLGAPAFRTIRDQVRSGKSFSTPDGIFRLIAATLVLYGRGTEYLAADVEFTKETGLAIALRRGPLVPEARVPPQMLDSNVKRWARAGILDPESRYCHLRPETIKTIVQFELSRLKLEPGKDYDSDDVFDSEDEGLAPVAARSGIFSGYELDGFVVADEEVEAETTRMGSGDKPEEHRLHQIESRRKHLTHVHQSNRARVGGSKTGVLCNESEASSRATKAPERRVPLGNVGASRLNTVATMETLRHSQAKSELKLQKRARYQDQKEEHKNRLARLKHRVDARVTSVSRTSKSVSGSAFVSAPEAMPRSCRSGQGDVLRKLNTAQNPLNTAGQRVGTNGRIKVRNAGTLGYKGTARPKFQ